MRTLKKDKLKDQNKDKDATKSKLVENNKVNKIEFVKDDNEKKYIDASWLGRAREKNLLASREQAENEQTIKKKKFYYLPFNKSMCSYKRWWVPYSESFKIYTNLMTYESLFQYKPSNRVSLIQKNNGTVTKTDNFLFFNEEKSFGQEKIDNFSFLKYEMALDKENFSTFFPYKSFVIPWTPIKEENSQLSRLSSVPSFRRDTEKSKFSTFQSSDYVELPEPLEKVKSVRSIYDKSALINFEIFKDTYLEKKNNGTLYNSIRNFYIPFDYILNNLIFPSFSWFNSVTFSYRHSHKTHTIIDDNWEEKKKKKKKKKYFSNQ